MDKNILISKRTAIILLTSFKTAVGMIYDDSPAKKQILEENTVDSLAMALLSTIEQVADSYSQEEKDLMIKELLAYDEKINQS